MFFLPQSYFSFLFFFFFFNESATTEIYTLSLHDALPISPTARQRSNFEACSESLTGGRRDRKSTRLNSSHEWISSAVFCLKKKKIKEVEDLVRKNKEDPKDHATRLCVV